MLRNAIVRTPSENFADGLTTAHLGLPDVRLAQAQHAAYCAALDACGLAVTRLQADPQYPDSTFVEDTAILTERRAILTRPGAPSRAGEVDAIRGPLSKFYSEFAEITGPGTLDGGDVCEIDGHFLIGISERTNEEGARQLSRFLEADGHTATLVDARGIDGILHLKSGIAYAGSGRVVATPALAVHPALRGYQVVQVDPGEAYAANCVRVNDRLLIAAGHPKLEAALRHHGVSVLPLEVSEFEKMDGGLSCLSLRF